MREVMTIIETAESMVAEVEREVSETDWEAAHSIEDDLREYVLEQIAGGTVPSDWMPKLAQIALRTQEMEFSRHCG